MTTATTIAPLRAYHGDSAIKENLLVQLRGHAAADEIIKGRYWENGRGCAVGCTIHSGEHARYEDLLGIPRAIAWLEDDLFESMPLTDAKKWPLRFAEAIPVGADLSLVMARFMVYLLTDAKEGVINLNHADDKPVTQLIADLYTRRINGDEPTDKEWDDAGKAAWAAREAREARAARAAREAREARAARAAWAAWEAWAAREAREARAARAAWAAWEAWEAELPKVAVRQADKLLELLAAAPVPK